MLFSYLNKNPCDKLGWPKNCAFLDKAMLPFGFACLLGSINDKLYCPLPSTFWVLHSIQKLYHFSKVPCWALGLWKWKHRSSCCLSNKWCQDN